jgi:hypothetical protein
LGFDAESPNRHQEFRGAAYQPHIGAVSVELLGEYPGEPLLGGVDALL